MIGENSDFCHAFYFMVSACITFFEMHISQSGQLKVFYTCALKFRLEMLFLPLLIYCGVLSDA